MSTDLTFITNEKGETLKQRFEVLIKDTTFFDCLVGYFYVSGFHAIYKSLENTQKIRILIGINTSKQVYETIKATQEPRQSMLDYSHTEAKQKVESMVVQDMNDENGKPVSITIAYLGACNTREMWAVSDLHTRPSVCETEEHGTDSTLRVKIRSFP